MAASRSETELYTSDDFVESAGAVLFRVAAREILVLHSRVGEYVLAKGRRNCGESRRAAAQREVAEESGLACRLLPLDMSTRAPPPEPAPISPLDPGDHHADVSRSYAGVCEPFAMQIRRLGNSGSGGGGVKIIWWFAAAVADEDKVPTFDAMTPAERERFDAVAFVGFDEALERLTFEQDREVVRRAIALVGGTYYGK
ncbi:hypothetical protein B0T26DRAFT_791123 [Lasiosphaeria miniovina]|uniref:Nudix hydrolase domain-containing protein n=1 Tax=Lasiosphaeria miniovina TaxID=1954250 RepID=A0AA40A0L5_9PEZI|nr:uncharacterized protein B0T26DRAFT_791123 [Lasiosphaeria miniovina]KAK0707132.1 hypothetical protein B0T26DRAFT_791123 [Lasiosphaeria miniovina]